jgi:glycosyltransferase involved in cell wall biosynthesis
MKVAFLLGYDPKKRIAYVKSSHLGVMRPFVNWAKALSEKSVLVFYKCPDVLRGMEDLGSFKSIIVQADNIGELVHRLNHNGVNYLISDDYIPRVELLLKLAQRLSARKGVYIQILYSMHALMTFNISFLPLKERLPFWMMGFVPFSLLKRQYKKLLEKQDIIIANSQITATLLHILYGVEPDGIVYPPLDTNIFRPRKTRKKNQVLLYLGSHAGDTDENFVTEICKVLKAKNFKILVMGNAILKEKLQKEFEIYSVFGVSDEELSNIYSQSKLTIYPQKWETFGCVPVETLACGTPVLAFDCMGPSETVLNGKTGWLAENK